MLKENITAFWKGCFGFGSAGWVVFQKILIFDYAISVLAIIGTGVLGGLATALAKDVYHHKFSTRIKKLLTKNKIDNNDKQKSKAA